MLLCVCVSFLWYTLTCVTYKEMTEEGGGEKLFSRLLSPISPPSPLLSPPVLTPTLKATSFGGAGAGSRGNL